jgi:hypothetical protein
LLNFLFFRFMTHIQTKKNLLVEYDIVGMFAGNLAEVGYVWWVDSGFFFFFRIHQKNLQPKSSSLFLLTTFVLRVFEISGFSWVKTWKYLAQDCIEIDVTQFTNDFPKHKSCDPHGIRTGSLLLTGEPLYHLS